MKLREPKSFVCRVRIGWLILLYREKERVEGEDESEKGNIVFTILSLVCRRISPFAGKREQENWTQ